MTRRWTAVGAALLLAAQAALAGAPTPKPAPPKGFVRPVVTAAQNARMTVGRGVLRIDSMIDYTVAQGEVATLSVLLPGEAVVQSVQCQGLRTYAMTRERHYQRLSVLLEKPAGGVIQLWLQASHPIPRSGIGQPVAFLLPTVAPRGVSRESGAIAVLADRGIKLDPVEAQGATLLEAVNIKAFADIKESVALAYTYAKRPFSIQVQATEIEAEIGLLRPPPTEKPQLLLHEATATGTVGDTVAKLSLKLAFEAIGREPPERVLLPPTVALTQMRLDAKTAARLVRDAEGYVLRCETPGDYSLELDYVVRVEKKDKIRTLSLPLVAAARSSTALTIPGGSVEVKLSPEIAYDTQAAGTDTLLTVYGAAVDQVTVTWEPKLEEKEVAAVVFADQNAQVSVGRGVLRVDTTLDYTILQGKVQELAVALPADATLLSVRGEGVRTWDVTTEGQGRLLKVALLDAASDTYQLQLQVEQAIAKGALGRAEAFTVPAIAAQDVERETGAVGILVWKGLKVEPLTTEGVTQVDVREMPAAFQKLKEQVHLAYRYLQRPFSIEAQVSEVEAKVSAEVLSAARVSPEALRVQSKIDYTIRDAGIFRFQIKLSKDVRLVDLEGKDINNWERDAETLTIDLRSKAEGPYTLTLETEQPIAQGTTEVAVAPIELLDVARERGHVALAADPGIKIEPVELTDIMQIDVRDLPKTAKNPAPKADLAFRYLKHPYSLRIAISKIEAEVDAAVHTALKIAEKNVEVNATVQYDIRKAGIFQLQVGLPDDFRLLGCDGPSIDDWKVETIERTEDGQQVQLRVVTVALKQKTEGKYALSLTGKQDVEDLEAEPIPIPNFTAQGAKKETGFIAVRADESLRVKADESTGLAEIDVKELPAELGKTPSVLAFRYFAQPWSGSLAVEPIDPHVTAETFTFLSLGEALLQASVTARYTILYAGVQTFKVRLPDGATNVDITGEDVKHKEEDKATHTWTVTLQAKRKGDYRLYVTFQQDTGGEQVDLKYQGLRVRDKDDPTLQDVKRETGYIAVAARSDLELAGGTDLEGLTPIDPQEIPADYKAGITAPLLLAFRYLQHPYTLHAVATKHDPADVLVAIIEACLLSTTLTEDGTMITDVACRLRNTREQNLAIALPDGAELWHVFVDGRRAVPVKSKEADVTWTKVPIAGVGSPTRPFVVQLRYGHAIGELGGSGVLHLDFPRLAIPAMRLGWRIAVPEKYRLVSHAGSLRHVPFLDTQLDALGGGIVPVAQQQQAVVALGKQSVQYRMNQMAIEQVQQEARNVAKGRWSGQRSIYTGSKPETANVYHFQSLIAMKDPGTIRSTYFRNSVDYVVQGVLVLVTLAAVVVFWRRFSDASRTWRIGVLAAVVLLVLGIRTLGEEAYRQHLTDVLWTLVAAAIAVVIGDTFARAKAAVTRRPSSKRKPQPEPEPPPAEAPQPEPEPEPEGPAEQEDEPEK